MSFSDIQFLLTSTYEFSYPFKFEQNFDDVKWIDWMQDNWSLSFVFAGIYICVVQGLKHYMKDRPRYDLRKELALWSAILAVFSIFMTARLLAEALYVLYMHGWEYTCCVPTIYFGDTGLWAFLFTASKLYELGDTVFIILRKQPLIFLHWYHHATVLCYTSFSYAYFYAPGRWFAAINSLVHSFMYSYYFLRAMRVRVPKFVNMFITSIQLLQMMIGMYVLFTAKWVQDRGEPCHASENNIQYGLLMYASYFLLFAHFFFNAYLKPKKSKIADEQNGHMSSAKTNGTAVSNGIQNGAVVSNGVQNGFTKSGGYENGYNSTLIQNGKEKIS